MMEHDWRDEHRTVNGISLHIVEAGPADGPLLILLHGFPEFWWGWRHQIAPLAGQGYHVVVPDMRGYNTSDIPQGVDAYRLETLTDDILALADSYGAERFRLVGHDWGGVIAWDLAARHPGRLEKLVVINGPNPDLWKRVMTKRPTQALRSSYAAFFQLPRLPEMVLGASNFRPMRTLLRNSARTGVFTPDVLDRYVEAWSHPGSLTAMLNYYRALRKRRLPAAPAPIRVPTLILWADNDVALETHVAEMALEACDDGRLEIIPDVTHWVHHEEPDHVNNAIIEFMA